MAYQDLGRPKTLVVTSRLPILNQWKEVMVGTNIKFMCIQSAYKHTGSYDLVIIDEVHRALSPKYREVFKNIKTKKLLCLTATLPDEAEYVEFLTKIAPVVYEKKLKDALGDDMVPQFEIYNLAVPLHRTISGKYKLFDGKFTQSMIKLTRYLMDDPKLKSKYKNVFELAQAAQWHKFDKELQSVCKSYWAGMTMRKQLVYSNPAKLNAVKQIIEHMGKNRKWIIFTKSITFAKHLQEYLGGETAIYHSKLKPIERELNLIAFEQNQFNILIAVDALNEGLNVSQVDAAICAAGVSTELTNSQQLGRIIRPEKGKKPVFINLYTEGTVEKTWVEKKLKSSGLKST